MTGMIDLCGYGVTPVSLRDKALAHHIDPKSDRPKTVVLEFTNDMKALTDFIAALISATA